MKFLGAYFYHVRSLASPAAVRAAFRLKMRPEAHVFGFGQLLPGWTVMARLHEIDVPTLVLSGRHDFLFPPEHQAILADRLPNAQLEIVERAGHNPHDERPAEVIGVIRRFLTTTHDAARRSDWRREVHGLSSTTNAPLPLRRPALPHR